jgi:signal transduction histidine kinase
LANDGAGGIWVGTDHGLNRLQESKVTRTYTTKDGLTSDEITCAIRDPRAGSLWVGTTKGGAVLKGERFVPLDASDMPASAAVTTIFNRRDGTLMIGTRGGGLYSYRDDRAEAVNQGETRHPDVTSFFEDEDGLLWVGTIGGGLRLIDGARTVTFGVRDGLFDDDIYGIVKDDQDRLWMPCSKGIFYVSRSDLRRFAAGTLHRVQCTPFSPTDALRTVECKSGVQPAAARMADGRLWFSTVRGVIVVDPQRIRRKAPPPPVVIEEMVVNGQRETGESKARLSPGVKNLEFRYSGLSFLSPGRMTFRYKLEGFDADWVDAGSRREAFYTNLGPGTYTFRVTASNADAMPTGAASPVVFSVAPYFYQRRAFIPACVGLLALAGWLAYRLRVRRIKGRMQDILTERSRIARELHDTLLQGFSGVTMEMQALSTRLPASGERATLEEIIRDAATCMREARRSVAGLRTPPGRQESSGFAAALAQAARQLTETRDVRLKMRLDGAPAGLPVDVEYNLLRIASEALSNAVRHSGARTIEVDLDCPNGRLVLRVKDDGVGFDGEPAAGAYAGHYGLVGMRERAAQVGAELELQSKRGRGTVVTVTLPMGAASGTAARVIADS